MSAYTLFFREGFSRVSMDAIAKEAGLTKRSLYYHFESKDDLAAAVLDHQNTLAMAHVGNWDDGSAATCGQFLSAMFDQLQDWANSPRWLGSGFSRMTMELADLPGHPARLSARNHKAALEEWLAGQLADRGARDTQELSRQTLVLIEELFSAVTVN